jgi:hypothetical protein
MAEWGNQTKQGKITYWLREKAEGCTHLPTVYPLN